MRYAGPRYRAAVQARVCNVHFFRAEGEKLPIRTGAIDVALVNRQAYTETPSERPARVRQICLPLMQACWPLPSGLNEKCAKGRDKRRRRKIADHSGFRASLRTIRFVGDWLLEEPVCCELLSGVKFPDHQGKYREFLRFGPS